MAEKISLTLKVNGSEQAAAAVEPRRSLVDFLRHDLGLVGTHVGCEHGVCGACTVMLDGRTVRSCLLFAAQADGSEVTTIEGIGTDEALHPLQLAFQQHHALQCGFCTPGMILAALELLRDNADPSDEEIRAGISGNLCMCTGYVNIVRAVRALRATERRNERTTKWVGQALERSEDRRLLTRGGHFIDDLTLPGVAHAAYVRSPHARAEIRHIDVRRALEHPGVYAVITGDEVAQLTRPQRGRVPLANSPKVYALAYQQVRYVGEPVVGIAAVDRAAAEDAADLIEVEYDPLPPVIEPEEALKPGAPLVFEEVGSNVLWHNTFPYGDVEGAFKEADTVVDERVAIHRYCSTPLETFGVMAQYEAATQSYTIWGHTQQPAQDLHVLAAALGISPGKIRLIVPPMGGSFGNKVRPLFIIAAALLARKAGRPVKWIEDRRENLLALRPRGRRHHGHQRGGEDRRNHSRRQIPQY